ncbi:DUF937 domain-containing protein [Sulfurovum sp.]|uniref:DUF937 domain-containing protein n=1 Tax=Sulfurovum sp. TaxID=1969726 RepID=UPI0025EF8D7A|nr:DUF937 domain-containing protein [Sulfurovum sp.]
MAGLIDMIINNPQIAGSIAKQVGIDIGDADSVIGKLAPILMGSAKKNLQSDQDSGGLLEQIGNSQFSEMLDKPEETMQRDDLTNIGNDILGELTGSKENSRKVAKHVEQETGMSASIIKKMLPMLAPLIIGALTKKAAPSINEYQRQPQAQSGGLESMITGMIDQDNDGSMIDDIMGMAMKHIFNA